MKQGSSDHQSATAAPPINPFGDEDEPGDLILTGLPRALYEKAMAARVAAVVAAAAGAESVTAPPAAQAPAPVTAAAPAPPPMPAESDKPSRYLLRRLGIIGMNAIEPAVLAALATEAPLLLVGPHGTAKSFLLTRLSEALGLTRRHYNASLLNYDDLVGYPLPDEHGNLQFIRTPASIWDAEAVFLDEISRCRPDMQNRLFSIIHERRVQGMPLERLVHRWAAMNPPPPEEPRDGEEIYQGSEALDPALADRFSFIVEVPSWASLTRRDKERVITLAEGRVRDEDARELKSAIRAIRDEAEAVEATLGRCLSEYVRILLDLVRKMGVELSGRRAGMLYRNIIAVHAARLRRNPAADPADSAWLAVETSVPQRASGRPLDWRRIQIVHEEAWKTASLGRLDPRRVVFAEPDPVRRAIKAVAGACLSTREVSAFVADALAEAPRGGRHALAHHVISSRAAGKLNTAVAEQVAELYAATVVGSTVDRKVVAGGKEHMAWQRIAAIAAGHGKDDPEGVLVENLLCGLFSQGELAKPEDVDAAFGSWQEVRQLCCAVADDGEDEDQDDANGD